MFDFHFEWHDAPGVRSATLARTWARFQIVAAGNGHCRRVISRNENDSAQAMQEGVYGSLFPLAEWLVDNWWFLAHEPSPVEHLESGRGLARQPRHRPWVRRHCLLTAAEGGALPDLCIFRDAQCIALHWAADPVDLDRAQHPVRFTTEGRLYVGVGEVQSACDRLIRAVLERLGDCEEPDALSLRDDWEQLRCTRTMDAQRAAAAAVLGIDWLDPEEAPDSLLAELDEALLKFEPALCTDFLEGTTADRLQDEVAWLKSAVNQIESSNGSHRGAQFPILTMPKLPLAHTFGYSAARTLREQLQLASTSAEDVLRGLGLGETFELLTPTENEATRLWLVGRGAHGAPHIVAPCRGTWPESIRFRWAQAVYFLVTSANDSHKRLISRAHTWDQRAARAFAAELLAPADALRQQVPPTVDAEQIHELAGRFGVSEWVIGLQIRNHHLADVAV